MRTLRLRLKWACLRVARACWPHEIPLTEVTLPIALLLVRWDGRSLPVADTDSDGVPHSAAVKAAYQLGAFNAFALARRELYAACEASQPIPAVEQDVESREG